MDQMRVINFPTTRAEFDEYYGGAIHFVLGTIEVTPEPKEDFVFWMPQKILEHMLLPIEGKIKINNNLGIGSSIAKFAIEKFVAYEETINYAFELMCSEQKTSSSVFGEICIIGIDGPVKFQYSIRCSRLDHTAKSRINAAMIAKDNSDYDLAVIVTSNFREETICCCRENWERENQHCRNSHTITPFKLFYAGTAHAKITSGNRPIVLDSWQITDPCDLTYQPTHPKLTHPDQNTKQLLTTNPEPTHSVLTTNPEPADQNTKQLLTTNPELTHPVLTTNPEPNTNQQEEHNYNFKKIFWYSVFAIMLAGSITSVIFIPFVAFHVAMPIAIAALSAFTCWRITMIICAACAAIGFSSAIGVKFFVIRNLSERTQESRQKSRQEIT